MSAFEDLTGALDLEAKFLEFALTHLEGALTVAAHSRDDLLGKRTHHAAVDGLLSGPR